MQSDRRTADWWRQFKNKLIAKKVQQDKNSKRKETQQGFDLIWFSGATHPLYSRMRHKRMIMAMRLCFERGIFLVHHWMQLLRLSVLRGNLHGCSRRDTSFWKMSRSSPAWQVNNKPTVCRCEWTNWQRQYLWCLQWWPHMHYVIYFSFYALEASVAYILKIIFVFQAADTYLTKPIFSVVSLSGH